MCAGEQLNVAVLPDKCGRVMAPHSAVHRRIREQPRLLPDVLFRTHMMWCWTERVAAVFSTVGAAAGGAENRGLHGDHPPVVQLRARKYDAQTGWAPEPGIADLRRCAHEQCARVDSWK